MQIPVLVETLPNGQGFRAKVGEPLALSADGPTKDDAIRQVKQLALSRLQTGSEIVPIELASGNPWIELAGFLPDDDLTRE
jgi:hypothetical protein